MVDRQWGEVNGESRMLHAQCCIVNGENKCLAVHLMVVQIF